MPIENADLETVTLSLNPQFLDLIERSRASARNEGAIPNEEMRRRLQTSTPFVTYANRKTPRVTIHDVGCSQIGKNGGTHKYGQGEYRGHATYSAAEDYANATGLPVVVCSFCKPADQG